MGISIEICGPGSCDRTEMWGGRAKLMAVVLVWETMRKDKGPGKAIEIQKKDVSGFVRKESLGSPCHIDIFLGTQDFARMPLLCLGRVGPLQSSTKH